MIKYIIKQTFYEIPKEVWVNGAWDKQDHDNVIEWIISYFFLTLLSLFSFEIAIMRSAFLMGVAWYLLKSLRRV